MLETVKQQAEMYRYLQAAALIKLHKRGRDVPAGKIDPSAILTEDEMGKAVAQYRKQSQKLSGKPSSKSI